MFPKNTMANSVATPKEQSPVAEKKETTVVYVIDEKDQQDAIQPGSPNNRARIYACAVVLTTLILVAGVLGALAIVFRGTRNLDAAVELTPNREGQTHDKTPQHPLPDPSTKPRIKIDDGGLWPPISQFPVTPDLVFVKDGVDDTITIGDGAQEPVVEGGIDSNGGDDFIIDEPMDSSSTRQSSDGGEEVTSSGSWSGDGEDQSSDYTPEDEYSPVAPDPDPKDQPSSSLDLSSSGSSSSPSSESSSSYSDPYVVSE